MQKAMSTELLIGAATTIIVLLWTILNYMSLSFDSKASKNQLSNTKGLFILALICF